MTKTTFIALVNFVIVIGSLGLYFFDHVDSEGLTSMILTGTTGASILIGYFTQDASKTIDLTDPKTIESIKGGADDLKRIVDGIKSKKK